MPAAGFTLAVLGLDPRERIHGHPIDIARGGRASQGGEGPARKLQGRVVNGGAAIDPTQAWRPPINRPNHTGLGSCGPSLGWGGGTWDWGLSRSLDVIAAIPNGAQCVQSRRTLFRIWRSLHLPFADRFGRCVHNKADGRIWIDRHDDGLLIAQQIDVAIEFRIGAIGHTCFGGGIPGVGACGPEDQVKPVAIRGVEINAAPPAAALCIEEWGVGGDRELKNREWHGFLLLLKQRDNDNLA
jgi:hypothetical protein